MNVLILDNYDSFVGNLLYLLRQELGPEALTLRRNNQISLDEVEAFTHVLLSPGPGLPSEAGRMPELIARYAGKKSLLGVCLGHQALGEHFGAQLYNLPQPLHGLATSAQLADDSRLFQGLPSAIEVGRYHSWSVAEEDLHPDIRITARDEAGQVLALEHKTWPLFGVQFHPESVLTQHGASILKNWLYTPTLS